MIQVAIKYRFTISPITYGELEKLSDREGITIESLIEQFLSCPNMMERTFPFYNVEKFLDSIVGEIHGRVINPINSIYVTYPMDNDPRLFVVVRDDFKPVSGID